MGTENLNNKNEKNSHLIPFALFKLNILSTHFQFLKKGKKNIIK